MGFKRVLRYIGNREQPEKELYDPLERIIHQLYPASEALMLHGLRAFSKHVVNPLFSDFEQLSPGSLFTPKREGLPDWLFSPTPTFWRLEPKEEQKPEPEFEVNLTEALVGWKTWNMGKKYLRSANHTTWPPDQATRAFCPEKLCKAVPSEGHSCGIYAGSTAEQIMDGEVLGQVYGWGRYVRGEDGWRAEFAYPKAFHLAQNQVELIEKLKIYHVPIYIAQPVRMYDPAEDGYKNEHWEAEAGGDQRTDQESLTSEEDYQDEDYDD